MKKLIMILIIVLLAGVVWAGEKEELTWKYRALVAEFNSAQQTLPQFRALQDFAKELEVKGFMIDKQGQVIEKPKPAPEPKK